MRLPRRGDDHVWSQGHLSHYVEGDMSWLARRRLELHANDCPECSVGVRALRALLRFLPGFAECSQAPPAVGMLDRVRADAAGTEQRPEGVDER